MLKVKKTTYGAIPKNNELLKLTSDIKHGIQKIEEEKNKKNKTINDYAKLIQSIKKEYQWLALENELLKKKMKKIEDKQFTTNLINHNKKQIEFFEGRKKRKHKKQHYVESSSEDSESKYYIPKKENQGKKWSKNLKGPTIRWKWLR